MDRQVSEQIDKEIHKWTKRKAYKVLILQVYFTHTRNLLHFKLTNLCIWLAVGPKECSKAWISSEP